MACVCHRYVTIIDGMIAGMQTPDDTQPRSNFQQERLNDATKPKMIYPEDEASGGPGCVLWGLVGMLSVLLAGVMVLISAYAGWNSGLNTARINATVTLNAEIDVQCQQMQTTIDNAAVGLLQRRIEFLELQTPAPACLDVFIPTATALYLQSIPTETETATATQTPTPTATAPVSADVTAEATQETFIEATSSTSNSLYDLDSLLAEAERDIAADDYQSAIDTLDAIIAIDENFQKSRVETLYFNALTTQATLLFRAGKLQEGIIMTGRAERFGDIQGLNYERFIAQMYLDAIRVRVTNPGESVRLYSRIIYEQGLSNYLGGQVMADLQEAYALFGDFLVQSADACTGRDQYNLALDMSPVASKISRPEITSKRDNAGLVCSGVVPLGSTTDGTATDASSGTVPTAPPTIAPVGQVGSG